MAGHRHVVGPHICMYSSKIYLNIKHLLFFHEHHLTLVPFLPPDLLYFNCYKLSFCCCCFHLWTICVPLCLEFFIFQHAAKEKLSSQMQVPSNKIVFVS